MKATSFIAIILGLCSMVPHGHAADDVATLTVTKRATLEHPAEFITLNIGVSSEAWKLDEARTQATDQLSALQSSLNELGLKPKTDYGEIRITDIEPIITRDGRRLARGRTANQRTSAGARTGGSLTPPELTGYEVAAEFTIHTDKLGLAPQIITQTSMVGSSSTLEYVLANPEAHRAAAIKQAVRDAMADASVLATAADSRLVRLSSLTLNASGTPSRASRTQRSGPTTDLKIVKVYADVTVVYEIAPADPESASGTE